MKFTCYAVWASIMSAVLHVSHVPWNSALVFQTYRDICHSHLHIFEFILRPGPRTRRLRPGEVFHLICKSSLDSITLYTARLYHLEIIYKSQHLSETCNQSDMATSALKAFIRALPDSMKSNCNADLEYSGSQCSTGNPYTPPSS